MSTSPADYYAVPGPMTRLPADVPDVDDDVSFVQNLFVHMFWAMRVRRPRGRAARVRR